MHWHILSRRPIAYSIAHSFQRPRLTPLPATGGPGADVLEPPRSSGFDVRCNYFSVFNRVLSWRVARHNHIEGASIHTVLINVICDLPQVIGRHHLSWLNVTP